VTYPELPDEPPVFELPLLELLELPPPELPPLDDEEPDPAYCGVTQPGPERWFTDARPPIFGATHPAGTLGFAPDPLSGAGELGAAGPGGDAGPGSGTTGTGTAGDTSSAPFGFVELIGHRAFNWNSGRHDRDVSIVIHLRTGEVVKDDLHWPFHYESESDDPFSDQHRNDDFPTLLQQPPAGYDLEGKQKPATVFAVRHTGPDGFTVLDECSVATR